MFLNTDIGGMNMVNLTHFIQAKQVKFLYKILKLKAEHENLTVIDKNWLQSLDQKFG